MKLRMKIIPNKYKEEPNWQQYLDIDNPVGMSLVFLRRSAAFVRDYGKGKKLKMYGKRDTANQRILYNKWIAYKNYIENPTKYPYAPKANKAAAPETSWHEFGLAEDWLEEWAQEIDKLAKTVNQTTLLKYGIFKPLTPGNNVSKLECENWHTQPIETAGIPKEQRKYFLDPDDEVYGGRVIMGDVAKAQTAMKAIGLYTGAIDDKPGPLSKKAATEFYKIIEKVLPHPDIEKLRNELTQAKNDIRVAKSALSKW